MDRYLGLLVILTFFCCCKNTLEDDISRIAYLHKKAKNNVNDSTLLYIKEAKILIDKNNKLSDTLRIENIFRKGYYYKQIEELDSASYYFHRTIDLVKAPNTRIRNLVYFQNTWQTDEALGNVANGISVAQKFIDISNTKDHLKDLVYVYNFLERMYIDLENYEKSMMYNSMTSDAALKVNNIDMFVITANSKANILFDVYDQKEEALKLMDSIKSIKTNENVKQQTFLALGMLNHWDSQYDKAIDGYKAVIELSKKIEYDRNYYLLRSYSYIMEAYLDKKDYTNAKKYLDTTATIITPSSFGEDVQFYNKLKLRYALNTNKNDYDVLEEYDNLLVNNKKVHEQNINEELEALKRSLEKEQIAINEKNIEQSKNLKLVILSALLGLLILLGFIFYRQRRFKFERESLQMQQRLLRSQMNPHFMFNTLSVIQNQIKDDKVNAVNYLMKFSRLLRLILENSLHDYVQIEDEMESLRKYLDLQLVRFPNKYNYSIITENFEENELLFIPPMLIQPFIENSIEHGFLGINYKGNINIKLSLQGNWITCTIEDNGIGLKQSNNKLKNSVSINLISKFIQKTTKRSVNIIDKETKDPNISGVLVIFLIPYKFSKHD